jgi:metallophosphoesterase (TIGR00282 family)
VGIRVFNVLFLGDIVGNKGRDVVAQFLPRLKAEYRINYTIANAENAAGGNGLTRDVARSLFDMGIDVLTSGNHIWDKREILDFIDDIPRIVRPYNYPPETPGQGYFITEVGSPPRTLAIVNLSGRTFMPPIDCPFRAFDTLYRDLPEGSLVLVDFHAEATSEKIAFGYHVDGRAAAVVGTHTHVQTADERLLPQGTAYITDLGMCGPYDSVLGVEIAQVTRRFITGLPTRFTVAEGPGVVAGVVLSLDLNTRSCHVPMRILKREEAR